MFRMDEAVRSKWVRPGIDALTVFSNQKIAISEVVKSAKEVVRCRRCSASELLLAISISTI